MTDAAREPFPKPPQLIDLPGQADLAHGTEVAADFAREMSGLTTETERLTIGVGLVVESVPNCDGAGVMLIARGKVETRAPTSQIVTQGDLLQYELGEGPCLDSVLNQTTVISNDVAGDPRWPHWGPAARDQLGIEAMLSLLLYVNEGSYGALNLYSTREQAFGTEDIIVAHALATHLALAIHTGRELDHRATALVNRTVIGQAEGILMERHRITADAAFQLLRHASQVSNRRLVAVSEELVTTGRLRGAP